MKIKIFIPFLFVCVLLSAQQQQPAEIKKSTEKVLLEGKVYFLHVIQQGQTVYSIAKAYGVSLQDIIVSNPGIDITQVRTGQVLRIPAKESPFEEEQELPDLEDNEFIYHKVKPSQTLYSISKKYDVPIEVIYSYNPETREGLKSGITLKIPKKNVLQDVIEAIHDEDNYYYYEVKKKDTLYSIAKRYKVTIADVVDINPELRWGIKPGQVLKIPKATVISETEESRQDTVPADTIAVFEPFTCDSIEDHFSRKTLNAALILPFMADQLNRSVSEDTLGGVPKTLKNNSGYFDFYQGVLVALDTLKKAGYEITLSVYDTKMDTNEMKRIIGKFSAGQPDLIIGPVYPENIKLVLDYAMANGIPVVSPFYNRTAQLGYYQKIFQVSPSKNIENEALAKYLTCYADQNIILVHDGDTVSNHDILSFKNHLTDAAIKTGKKILIKEILHNDTIKANLQNELVNDRKNVLVILSDNAIYVNGLISKLDISAKRYDIMVIGQPTWLSFQTINIENYHNLEVTLLTPFFIDFNQPETEEFLKHFRSLYGIEPTLMNTNGINASYLGYDVMTYFVKTWYKYGTDFYGCLRYFRNKGLLSNFSFTQLNPGSGFENTSMNIIKFEKKDFKVTKAGTIKKD